MIDPKDLPNDVRGILDTETRLAGRLGPDGKQMIAPIVQGATDPAQALVDVEKKAQAALLESQSAVQNAEGLKAKLDDLDDRTAALHQLIRDKILTEREQIVASLIAYAEDCQARAAHLEQAGHRERKRLRKTGHVIEAEKISKTQNARAAAFKVRAAIIADAAHKIENRWGRNPDGTAMTAAEVDVDASDLMAEAAAARKGG